MSFVLQTVSSQMEPETVVVCRLLIALYVLVGATICTGDFYCGLRLAAD